MLIINLKILIRISSSLQSRSSLIIQEPFFYIKIFLIESSKLHMLTIDIMLRLVNFEPYSLDLAIICTIGSTNQLKSSLSSSFPQLISLSSYSFSFPKYFIIILQHASFIQFLSLSFKMVSSILRYKVLFYDFNIC